MKEMWVTSENPDAYPNHYGGPEHLVKDLDDERSVFKDLFFSPYKFLSHTKKKVRRVSSLHPVESYP